MLLRFGLLCVYLCGCGMFLPNRGGGEIEGHRPREIAVVDVAMYPGYAIEPVARGLTFPTAVVFDDKGGIYVVEAGYSYGDESLVPKLVRVEPDGSLATVATGENNGPWTGALFHKGGFYIAEGGSRLQGRIVRVEAHGAIQTVVDNLPTGGDHHTNAPVLGPDGKLYFSLGTMTNAGIVGPDNAQLGWLKRHRSWHDVPCKDVTLAGTNFESEDPFAPDGPKVQTGAFLPFGTPSAPGQRIAGQVPCSGAVLRMAIPEPPARAGELELVAWGFRNPFGLAFTPQGELLVTDNGYDVRGSRPVWGNADWLWVVNPQEPPQWYGWPDYADGRSLTAERYEAPDGPKPGRLLAEDPNPPRSPRALFATHSSSSGIAVSRNPKFGMVGQAFVAQFGDQSPVTGKIASPTGFKVVKVDVRSGVIEDFAINHGAENGPASLRKNGGLERPLGLSFSPDGTALYVVDFGVLAVGEDGMHPQRKSGVLWRIKPLEEKR